VKRSECGVVGESSRSRFNYWRLAFVLERNFIALGSRAKVNGISESQRVGIVRMEVTRPASGPCKRHIGNGRKSESGHMTEPT